MTQTETDASGDADLPTLVDQKLLRELPTTARGIRRRDELIVAARKVFERDGFLNARLVDITAEANCSVGTFYTYFDSKEEIFAAVMQAAQDDMMHPGLPRVEPGEGNLADIIRASNAAYIAAYRRNAKLMILLEQVASNDPHFRELRLARADAFTARNAAHIKKLQEKGLVDPQLDPDLSARALSSMVSRTAYYIIALEHGPIDDEKLCDTLTRLWVNALGLKTEPSDS